MAGRPRVTVVGLGPAGVELLTEAARAALSGPGTVFLRTRRHPAAEALQGVLGNGAKAARSFDHHYETAPSFEEVYGRIVEDLVAAASSAATSKASSSGGGGGVVYAVPGSPLVAERTVELLRADRRVEVTVVPALSFADLAWERLGVDPLASGARLVDGTRFAEQAAGGNGPFLVGQCWSPDVLSAVKLAAATAAEEAGAGVLSATLLHHLGLPDERVEQVSWDDLDRTMEPDHLTSVWVPRLGAPVAGELVALEELVRRLRSDCPWDREQTHASLTRHLLEEAYEVLDAIAELDGADGGAGAGGAELDGAGGDAPGGEGGPSVASASAASHLEEELGDLLFQVYFHSRLAAEEGWFTLADVARTVHDKLVSRHPHVFGDAVARDAGAVLHNWEQIKKAEKGRQSVTDGIPATLPALALAAKLQRKAVSVPVVARGSVEDSRDRARRLLGELASPAPAGARQRAGAPPEVGRFVHDAGELLWSVADLVRRLGVEPEDALRAAALRFRQHVRAAEGVPGEAATAPAPTKSAAT